MPQQNDRSSAFPLIMIAAVIWLAMSSGWLGNNTPKPPDDSLPAPVDPVTPRKPTEAEVWSALADYTATRPFGVLNSHTHHVVLIVDELKRQGLLTDTSRVDKWRSERQSITDGNLAEIVSTIRGK